MPTVFAWLDRECRALAAAFDARNETTKYADGLAKDLTVPVQPLKYER